jgi:hypothetical protein
MELFKNKETDLEFKLNLEGNSSSPDARLLIESTGGIFIGVRAHISEGVVSVRVPALASIMKETPSSCNMLLEVMVDEGYYVPWQEASVPVKSETTVTVSEATVKHAGASKVAVQMKATTSPLKEKAAASTTTKPATIDEFFRQRRN